MTQTILLAIAALAIDVLILRWAFREEVYGRDMIGSLVRVPCIALTILIPVGTIIYLVEKGLIQ